MSFEVELSSFVGPSPPDGPRERDEVLSTILKAIRRRRGLTVQQVANRMGLKKRSYERFEAGLGLLKVERIFTFAQATDSDPYALLASVRLGKPDFALACIDNKLVMLQVAHARELFRLEGAALAQVQPQAIIESLTGAFTAMRAELEAGRKARSKWLGETSDGGGEAG